MLAFGNRANRHIIGSQDDFIYLIECPPGGRRVAAGRAASAKGRRLTEPDADVLSGDEKPASRLASLP